MNKEIEDLRKSINQFDIKDIYRILYASAEYMFFSHRISPRIDYVRPQNKS